MVRLAPGAGVTMFWPAAQFAACTALIVFSGVRLSRHGDVIAERTGLGGTWMGLVAMAAITSLPELITGASSVVIFDVPDIAVGDAVGSCMFNLVILAMLDVRNPVPLSARIHHGHVLAAALGVVQLGLVGLAILTGARAPAIGWIGVHSVLFLVLYALSMRMVLSFERTRLRETADAMSTARNADASLQRAVTLYAMNAVVLIGAAVLLPGAGERLAHATGLQESFVGSLFVAMSTSLPEITVSIAAARIGAVDMAAANLFGSNLFNVAVLGVDDILFTEGPLLAVSAPTHVISAVTAMMMSAVAIVGLTYRAQRKRLAVSWDGLGIVALYVIGIVALFRAG